jgi:hypothetical protein
MYVLIYIDIYIEACIYESKTITDWLPEKMEQMLWAFDMCISVCVYIQLQQDEGQEPMILVVVIYVLRHVNTCMETYIYI